MEPFSYFARGHMVTLVTVVLVVRGWRAHNHPTISTVMQLRSVLGFNTHFWSVFLVERTEVRFGEPKKAWRKKMAGGLSSSFFGQMRCRKSSTRGFWTFWIHWHYFQIHLKTSFAGFSPLKFQRALGSLKPSLIEVMLRWAQVCFLWLNSHFWLIVMLWTHWDRFQIHLKTFTGVFSTRKLREAQGHM